MEQRKTAVENYYGEGKHIYIDELGWRPDELRVTWSLKSVGLRNALLCTQSWRTPHREPGSATICLAGGR